MDHFSTACLRALLFLTTWATKTCTSHKIFHFVLLEHTSGILQQHCKPNICTASLRLWPLCCLKQCWQNRMSRKHVSIHPKVLFGWPAWCWNILSIYWHCKMTELRHHGNLCFWDKPLELEPNRNMEQSCTFGTCILLLSCGGLFQRPQQIWLLNCICSILHVKQICEGDLMEFDTIMKCVEREVQVPQQCGWQSVEQ